MHDQFEQSEHYEELAAYTSRRAALPGAEQVRSAGTRRLKRRRFGQAAAATGALAVAGALAASLPADSSHATTTVGAAADAAASPSVIASPSDPGSSPTASAGDVAVTGDPTGPAGAGHPYASAGYLAPSPGTGTGTGTGRPSQSTQYVITLEGNNYLATTKGAGGSPDIFGLGFKGSGVASSLIRLGFRTTTEDEHSASVPAGDIISITSPLQVNEMGKQVSPADDILFIHISLGS